MNGDWRLLGAVPAVGCDLQAMQGWETAMRLHYIDWLRVLVISLVVAHHAGMAYAAFDNAWPVHDAARTNLLTPFFAVNAAFGMGFLFFIAGYFVPGSLARKGAINFLRDRTIRLGIPLVVFGFGVFALIGYGNTSGEEGFWSYYRNTYIGQWRVEFSHLWFVWHLLLYSIVYTGIAMAFPTLVRTCDSGPVENAALVALVVLMTLTGGVVRLVFPQDTWIKLLGLVPIEPAHLPQYILMFAAGTIAGRHGWFDSLPHKLGSASLRIGMFAVLLCYALVYLDCYGGIPILRNSLVGSVYPIWEAVLCVSLSVGIMSYAREHWDRTSLWLPLLAGATYGVYLLHIFVVIGFNTALVDVALPAMAKFLLAATLTLMTTFFVVALLRKIPLVSRVL